MTPAAAAPSGGDKTKKKQYDRYFIYLNLMRIGRMTMRAVFHPSQAMRIMTKIVSI